MSYTLGNVVGTLTMIETPSTAIAIPLSEEEAIAKDDGLAGAPATVVAVKPITSSIRGTVRHITSIAGLFARWRGFVPTLIYGIATGGVSGLLGGLLPRVIPGRHIIAQVLAAVLLARTHMACTHAIISMPSSLWWYQRIAPMKSIKKLWLPNVVNMLAGSAVVYLTMGFTMLLGLCSKSISKKQHAGELTKSDYVIFVFKGLAILLFAASMVLFVALPAAVTLHRVEASMLPEDQETIVPFDRTFDGKVVPQILGGSGAIGFVDAWRTFNWEARRRLIKYYFKTFLIMAALFIVFAHVILFEFWAILGPKLGKSFSQMKNSL
jgi:hypothetical protein